MKKITDKAFRYTPSFNTDLRRSFKRYAAEEKAKAEREQQIVAEQAAKVEPITTRRKVK